jgi:hypothetical protein
MLKNEHERFLELIVEYYNRREDWLENNTRKAGIEYRRVLKEIREHSKMMLEKIQNIQHERRRSKTEKGYTPRKAKPIDQ